MRAFIDMDGVIADFHEGVIQRFGVDRMRFIGCELPLPWDWVWSYLGIKEPDFWRQIDESFWSELPKTAEADEVMSLVEARFGDQVYILSNPGPNPSAVAGKMRWIRRYYPQYEKRVLLGAPKHACAAEGRLLIDDAEHNIDAFVEHGGHGLLVPRMWNRYHDRVAIDELRGQLS